MQDSATLKQFLQKNPPMAVISCLPYYHNVAVANLAKEFNLHYFDLTEDRQTAIEVLRLAQNSKLAFVPQCGLAPGFISIVAHDLMQHFPQLDTVKLRVGALPTNISNSLQYALTWSTDGLINEYANPCQAIDAGKEILTQPLEDLEEIDIDGLTYEAFNTSGGLGTLAQTYLHKVDQLNYKTIRYPGHCAKIRFLMHDLKLSQDRDTLKRILENAIPRTYQDVVLVYVSVSGKKNQALIEENYVQKFYPQTINGILWSAIQMTTASSLCAVIDLVLSSPGKYRGLVKQEMFSLEEIVANRFGKYYAKK
jgi:saccharopine dehydrogenase-like NADP-dependent oxidoreductase